MSLGLVARNSFLTQTEALHRSRAKIFDQHVGAFREAPKERDAFLRFEIDGDALFVSIDAKKIGALSASKWRTPTARIVADTGLFDFDNLGAQVAEKHGAVGTGQDAGEIENSDAIKGTWVRITHLFHMPVQIVQPLRSVQAVQRQRSGFIPLT